MNAIFDLKRFWNYALRDFNRAKMFYFYLVGILFLFFIVGLMLRYTIFFSLANVFFGLILFSAIAICIVSPCYDESLNKRNAMFSFILPVSNVERFIHFFLKYVVFIPLICLVCIFIIQLIMKTTGIDFFNRIHDSDEDWDSLLVLYGLQSAFMLGYFYFKKHAMLKTILFGLLGIVSFYIVGRLMLYALVGEYSNVDFGDLYSPLSFVKQQGGSPHPVLYVTNAVFRLIFPFGIWLVTYFKLKETEI